jgi:hypothetical protein
MSSVKFSYKKLKKGQLAAIDQIEYLMGKYEEDLTLLQIRAFNNLLPRSTSNPYDWCVVPSAYIRGLALALYRLETLKFAAADTEKAGGDQKHIDCTSANLVYLDAVLDKFWIMAKSVGEALEMTNTWRYTPFNQWILAEFFIHKHSPEHIAKWEASNPDIDWSSVAIEELGAFTYMGISGG